MIECLVWLVMKIISSAPAAIASFTAYCTSGLSTTGKISLALALVAGRKRVPRRATGHTALRIRIHVILGVRANHWCGVYCRRMRRECGCLSCVVPRQRSIGRDTQLLQALLDLIAETRRNILLQ